MSQGIAIRVGYHKCGSTHLGHTVFQGHSQIRHLGKPYDRADPVRELIERLMDRRDGFDLARCRALVEDHVRPHADRRLVTLSDGRLAFWARTADSPIPQRLFDVFGPCRILVTIRRHEDFVKSLYVQHFGTGKTAQDIDPWLAANWREGIRFQDYIAFAGLVRRFAEVFGRERISVSLLERFADDRDAQAAELGRFLGIDGAEFAALLAAAPRNPRMSVLQRRLGGKKSAPYAAAKAIAQRLPPPVLRVAAGLTGHHRRYEPELGARWREAIREVAREDSAALRELYDLPLARYGYAA